MTSIEYPKALLCWQLRVQILQSLIRTLRLTGLGVHEVSVGRPQGCYRHAPTERNSVCYAEIPVSAAADVHLASQKKRATFKFRGLAALSINLEVQGSTLGLIQGAQGHSICADDSEAWASGGGTEAWQIGKKDFGWLCLEVLCSNCSLKSWNRTLIAGLHGGAQGASQPATSLRGRRSFFDRFRRNT